MSILVTPDAFAPPEMAARAARAGARKAELDALSLFTLAVLAGAFIALGAQLATVVGVDARLGAGPARLLAGVAFSLGLVLVVVGGAELFTGNMLLVIARLTGEATTGAVLRNWGIVYAGNFAGAVATAALMAASGQAALLEGGVGAAARATADAKLALGFGEAVVRGVLGNGLVCLAVWLGFSARTTTDKVIAVVPPVAAFVAAGFEHSIANMYFLPLALFLDGTGTVTWARIVVDNLVPVTLGNVLGGVVLVGAIYWLVYLRPGRPGAQPEERR